MIEFIKVCGLFGMLSLGTALILMLAGIAIIWQSKSRRALVKFAIIALLPLVIGVLGTVAGYAQISRAEASMESPDQAVAERDREMARYTTYLGFGCSAMLWVMIGVGASLNKRNGERADSTNRPTATSRNRIDQ